jgi:serine/threonine protein kinase
MDSAEIVTRFRHEEQILASLNHPNIAQLYGAGVTAGDIPYFAMEYVAGTRIDEYCNAQALSAAARLQLFRKACAAVHYAHQRLVIHRDLKPSNILVTGDGEPKLLDFGIAKLIEGQDLLTQMQTLPGAMTPDYASPEQIRGEAITTSSDVYSLGVLLYEILTGRRPYRLKTRSAAEIASAITDQEPDRPSTAIARGDRSSFVIRHSSFPKGDLDNIVLMALRKEPLRRYASAEQFSEDIRRYLEGRPIIAHKATIAYRATKFVKRQKLAVAAALVILGTLIAAVVLTSQQKRRAERRFNDVRQLSNALLFDIAPKIERLQSSTEAREALVRRALEYLDSLGQESGGDEQLQSELANAYEKVGDLQGAPRKPNLSDFNGAIASYEKAQVIRRRRLEKNPADPEARRRLAANLHELSSIRFWTGDIAGSLRDGDISIKLYETLVAEQPAAIELKLALIESNLEYASILFEKQQFAQTYPYLRTALASLEEIRRTRPDDREVRHLLGNCHTQLGISLSWDGKQAEGESEITKAVAIREPLVQQYPNDAIVRHGLWVTYLQASSVYEEVNPALSEEFALKALRLVSETVERDAFNTQARQSLAQSHSKLAASFINAKKLSEAIQHTEKALAILAELERNEPRNVTYKRRIGVGYTRLGDARHQLGDLHGALEAFTRSVASFEQVYQADAQNTAARRDSAQAYKNIGNVHRDLAGTVAEPVRQTHLQAAQHHYRLALDILHQLKAQGAFAQFDQKLLEELQAAVQR